MTATITHTEVEIFVPILVYHDSNNYTHKLRYLYQSQCTMTTTITHTQVEIFVPVLVYHDNNNNHTHKLRYLYQS